MLDFNAMSKLGEKLNAYLEKSEMQFVETNEKLSLILSRLEHLEEILGFLSKLD